MERREKVPSIETILDPLLDYMGIQLVECSSHGIRDSLQVRIVISKREGISIEECATVHKTLLPRLEAALGRNDISIEVSSPGLTRNIKTADEFPVFTGRGVKVFVRGKSEWIQGIIKDADETRLTMETAEGAMTIEYSEIQKARLEYIGG